MSFDFLYANSLEEYVEKFKEIFFEDIILFNGVRAYAILKEKDILHILCGKGKTKIKKARASRISWIKEHLENVNNKSLIKIGENNNLLFVGKHNKTHYLIVCEKNKKIKKLRILSFYICSKRQFDNYLKLADCDLNNIF